MAHRSVALESLVAGALVVATVVAWSGAVLGPNGRAVDGHATDRAPTERQSRSVLETVEGLLQDIDDFLETVADLLRTIRTITGEGTGGE